MEMTSGLDVATRWVEQSPFCAALGIRATALEADRVELVLPYDESKTTYADMVHGGALAAFADIAATVAAWSGAALPDTLRGVTVSLNVDFLSPARAADVVAIATITRRGRSLCFCAVEMSADDEPIARATAIYKIG
jgi:uncharacterized protein (TIGR00369 family)